MSAEEILDEAEYGIQQIKLYDGTVKFYIRATLASLKSVFDYLLEEYNLHFGLGISLNDHLDAKTFRKIAMLSNNAQALEFIDFFDNSKDQLLSSDPRLGLLLETRGLRDLAIHRRNVGVGVKFRDTPQMVKEIEKTKYGIRIVPLDGDATFIKEIVFSDYDMQDIPTVCEFCLESMRIFVKQIRQHFPT